MQSNRRSTALLLTMSLIIALVTLDTTITGVILGSIGHSLHASFQQLEWVMAGYMLPFASLLLPAGAWADFRGRKQAVLTGLTIFGLSSLLCGLAPTAGWLVAARIAQGIGAAFLTGAIAIIGHSFRGEARLKAFATLGSVIGIATVLGPMMGGILASWAGWKWAFLVNPPLCAGLAIATLLVAEESRDPSAATFDLSGVSVFSVALVLLTSALISANSAGLLNASVAARIAGSAVLFALFMRVERAAARPMIDPALLGRPPFLAAVVSMAGYAATAQILIFYVPMHLQASFGFSAMSAGVRMAPFAVPLFVMPRLAAQWARVVPARVLLTAGLALTCAGNLAMALAIPTHSYAAFAVGMAIAGAGAGILNGESTKAFFSSVPANQSGTASGLATTTRFSGLLIAIAVIGAILSRTNFVVVFAVQAALAFAAAGATFQLLRNQSIPAWAAHAAPAVD